MKFSGYRKRRKNISGSKRFKIVAPLPSEAEQGRYTWLVAVDRDTDSILGYAYIGPFRPDIGAMSDNVWK